MTFQQRVNEKMEEQLADEVAFNGLQHLYEAVGNDDRVLHAVFHLIFTASADDFRSAQDDVQHELIAYLGAKYEQNCADVVKAEDADEAIYQREMADEMRHDQMRDERWAA